MSKLCVGEILPCLGALEVHDRNSREAYAERYILGKISVEFSI